MSVLPIIIIGVCALIIVISLIKKKSLRNKIWRNKKILTILAIIIFISLIMYVIILRYACTTGNVQLANLIYVITWFFQSIFGMPKGGGIHAVCGSI